MDSGLILIALINIVLSWFASGIEETNFLLVAVVFAIIAVWYKLVKIGKKEKES